MIYDPILSILAIVLIPVLIWWYHQTATGSIKSIGYFIILFFAQGSLELTGLNQTLVRYMFELPIVSTFLILVTKRGIRKIPGFYYVICFIVSSVISMISTTALMWLFFLLYYLEVVFIFYYFYHLPIDRPASDLITKLFIVLCISQFAASIIKYFMVGFCEPYIGSMSSHSGGVTTLFSLAGFSAAVSFYVANHSKLSVYMMIGFIVFGLIGEKRALVFLIPIFYFVCISVYSFVTRKFSNLTRKIMIGIVVMPLLFYALCRLHPSFNPERKIWGSFDIEYVLDYAEKYSTGDMFRLSADNVGRSKAIGKFHDHLLNDTPFHIFFGYGSGLLIQSSFNEKIKGGKESSIVSYSLSHWGIGYSMGIGYLQMLAQVGLVGTTAYFMFFFCLVFTLVKLIKKKYAVLTPLDIGYGVASLNIIVSAIALSFFYNATSMMLNPVTLMMMWFVAYSIRRLETV